MAKRKFEGGRVRVLGWWAIRFYIMEERQQRGKRRVEGCVRVLHGLLG